MIEASPCDEQQCPEVQPLLKKLVNELGLGRATPHDLRRTCLTSITRLNSAATPWTGSPTTGRAG